MYRYHYPVWDELMRALRRVLLLVLGLILFFMTVELVRAYQLFYGFHPWLGYAFAGLVLCIVLYTLLRLRLRRHDRQTLLPPRLPNAQKPRHEDLTSYTAYLVHRLKRLSLNPSLPEELGRKTRQKAYDLEGLLASHPLIEDLVRANSRAEVDTLEPAQAALDQRATELGKDKIRCVIEDAVEPPFPLITPLVVLYHQITLITSVTEVYLGRPSLREYCCVLLDVLHTIRGGDFFRIGQRLFEGAYVNSPPLGRAVDDLGQAVTSTWLTWSVTKAAMYRCRGVAPWNLKAAVEWLDQQTAESLGMVRDVLIADVLPLLKLRIRHNIGPGITDAAAYTEQVTQSVARAVEVVVKGLSTQNPARAAQLSRRTQAGLEALPDPHEPRHHPASRSWRRRGLLGILRSFAERQRYARRHPSDLPS